MQNYLEKAKQWLKSDNCWQKIKRLKAQKNENPTENLSEDTSEDPSIEIQVQQQTEEKTVLEPQKQSSKEKDSFKEYLGYAAYYAGSYKKYILAGCSGVVLVTMLCLYQAFSMGYVISADGEKLFTVLNEEDVYAAVKAMEADVKQELGVEVCFEDELEVKRSLVRDSKVYSEEQIQTCLDEKLGSRVNAVAIVVDGNPKIYVPDQETAEKVLAELKESGSTVGEGETLKEVALKETIEMQDCQVAVRNLDSAESALELIRTGEEKPMLYTVESGDTLWTIARAHDMMVDQITTINNLNENEILSIGQELVLSKCDPLISVVATIERKETQQIPFETELKEDNSVNGIKITQEGENGEKIVSYATTRVNGITTEEYVTGEEITKEVKNRVVVRGNQVTLASRGLTQSAGVYSGGVRLTYPTQGTITQYFGRHTGLDIANSTGTNIVAAGDGVVTYVHYSNYSYGNYVVIDHLNGIVTRYAHCSKIYVSMGDSVKAGQSIAAMGSTGNSTGPHLHFEVLVNGAFVNPFAYL